MKKTTLSIAIGLALYGSMSAALAVQEQPISEPTSVEQPQNGQQPPQPKGYGQQPPANGGQGGQRQGGQPQGGQPQGGQGGQPQGGQPQGGQGGQPQGGQGGQPQGGQGGQPQGGQGGHIHRHPPNKELEKHGINPDDVKNFGPDDVTKLPSDAIGVFNEDNFADLPPNAAEGFSDKQMEKVGREAVKGMKPGHIENMGKDAFKGFRAENMGGLGSEAMGAITPEQLGEVDPNEIERMPEEDRGRMIAHMPPDEFTDEEISRWMPKGWEKGNGNAIKRPPKAPIGFAAKPPGNAKGWIEVPDLAKGFGIGGAIPEGEGSAEEGLKKVVDENFGLDINQRESGVLRVTSSDETLEMVFLPHPKHMRQGEEDARHGIELNGENGQYEVTLDNGAKIPVIPCPKDPEELEYSLPEGSSFETGEDGNVLLNMTDRTVSTVFDPTVEEREPLEERLGENLQQPGLHIIDDETGVMSYEDGSAQIVRPTMNRPDKFREAAENFPGVTNVKPNIMAGTFIVVYEGVRFIIKPAFNVVPPKAAPEEELEPTIDQDEEGEFYFEDEYGNNQTFDVEPE